MVDLIWQYDAYKHHIASPLSYHHGHTCAKLKPSLEADAYYSGCRSLDRTRVNLSVWLLKYLLHL